VFRRDAPRIAQVIIVISVNNRLVRRTVLEPAEAAIPKKTANPLRKGNFVLFIRPRYRL
jgi:hypothetical protein